MESGGSMTDLLTLAERCEQATGPDRALDDAIWLAVRADESSRKAYQEGLTISQREAAFRLDYMSDGFSPTASLDAAMTLVPDMCLAGFKAMWDGENAQAYRGTVDCYEWIDGLLWKEGFLSLAAFPALALCAAALRARAAHQSSGMPKGGEL
jgi:hypothetical protein